MDSSTGPFGHDAPDSRPLSDINRPGICGKASFEVVKAEAESATMSSPADSNSSSHQDDKVKDSSPQMTFLGDKTPTKSTPAHSSRIDRIRESLESSIRLVHYQKS